MSPTRASRLGWAERFGWTSLVFFGLFSMMTFETSHWFVQLMVVLNLGVFVASLAVFLTGGSRGVSA